MVLRAGLEPARISPHAPQTCAATNYATSANFQKNYLFSLPDSDWAAFAAGAVLAATLESAGVFAAGTTVFDVDSTTAGAVSAGASLTV